MDYNLEFAKAIKAEYDFNDYEIEKDKLIEVAVIVEKVFNGDVNLFGKFIQDLRFGKLGMWYKSPISFISLANKYKEQKLIETPKQSLENYEYNKG